jgi:hypothetical protein
MSTPQTLLPKDQVAFAASTSGDEPYILGPDSLPRDGVPRGKVSRHHLTSQHSYPGVGRDYWLYIPQHPETFSKVVSHCGSFVDFRGGHNYPSRIRQSRPKPLRIFLQCGSRDLDLIFGSWSIANHDVAAALAYREYDYKFVYGEGGHTLMHGGALFPDTLRWLWRDYSTSA